MLDMHPVAKSVRDRVLDVLGLCIGARSVDTSTAILDYVRAQGGTDRHTPSVRSPECRPRSPLL
jgi:hypothetical protein